MQTIVSPVHLCAHHPDPDSETIKCQGSALLQTMTLPNTTMPIHHLLVMLQRCRSFGHAAGPENQTLTNVPAHHYRYKCCQSYAAFCSNSAHKACRAGAAASH